METSQKLDGLSRAEIAKITTLIKKDPEEAKKLSNIFQKKINKELIKTNEGTRNFIYPALNDYFDEYIAIAGNAHEEHHKGKDYEEGAKNDAKRSKERVSELKNSFFEILDNYEGNLKERLSDLFLEKFLYIDDPVYYFHGDKKGKNIPRSEHLKSEKVNMNSIYAKYYETGNKSLGEVNGAMEDFSPERNLEILKRILEDSVASNSGKEGVFHEIETPFSNFSYEEKAKLEKRKLQN